MAARRVLSLDKQKGWVKVNNLILEEKLIYSFFDAQPEKEREKLLVRAILLGVLALQEERLSAFLSKTANTLGTELESLKYIFDLQKELFYRTTGKGREAEEEIVEVLKQYVAERGYKDEIVHVGERVGELPGNKTGDIIGLIEGREDTVVAIESKFDKGKTLGEITKRNPFSSGDTAISQLLEARANRKSKSAIIVFDKNTIDGRLLREIGSAQYISPCGFVCIVDSQRGDYLALFLCYELARSLSLKESEEGKDKAGILSFIIGRFIYDLNCFIKLKEKLLSSIKDTKEMIKLIEQGMLSLEFSKDVFNLFLENGRLSPEDLFKFYSGAGVKEKYKAISQQIEEVIGRL